MPARRLALPTPLLLCALVLAAAGCDDNAPASDPAPTYYGEAKAIIDARCVTCHQPGNIGPFPLTTLDAVRTFAGPVRIAIESGTMPPWQPSDSCNTYAEDFDLTSDEKATLLAWLDADTPEGDPADAPAAPTAPVAAFQPDLLLQLPEAYTPTREPDDYRCQLIPWPADETRFVTGLRVTPDQRAIVHHVIVFVAGPDQAAQYQAYDDAEDGPGYTCYGGPRANDAAGSGGLGNIDPVELLAALDRLGLTIADLQSGNLTDEQRLALVDALGDGGTGSSFSSMIGSWVPGAPTTPYPAGTGIRIEPGSMLVAQFHYNTLSSDPAPDRSTIEIATAPSVAREAFIMPVVDLGWVSNGIVGDPMTIPAGAPNVEHAVSVGFDSLFMNSARTALGLSSDAPLVIHRAGHHMHELGTYQRTELRRADGTASCVLDIPQWDFAWQGAYTLDQAITVRAGDALWMRCAWDNTIANQPIIDGEVRDPVDVAWGEGTEDEMCLGTLYVTSE